MAQQESIKAVAARALERIERNRPRNTGAILAQNTRNKRVNLEGVCCAVVAALNGLPMTYSEAMREFSELDHRQIETGELSPHAIRHFLVYRCYYQRRIKREQVKELLAHD